MDIISRIKMVEKYVCDNFEELDLDDPVEEEYFAEYENIQGATKEEIMAFERKFNIVLPNDLKELYQYKNGSRFFSILPTDIGGANMTFSLMSLQQIEASKEHFQNKDSLLSQFPDYFTDEDIEKMKDSRIQPYLFNKRWIPFAEYCGSCYLMLDYAPNSEGIEGQIICYIHDPDKIVYVADNISHLVSKIVDKFN